MTGYALWITVLDASSALRGFRAQGALVQFGDGLQGLLELAVILEPLPDLRQLVTVQADLTIPAAGVVDVENPLGMTDAVGAHRTTAGMEGGAVEKGATQDLGEGGDAGDEAVESGCGCHL